VPELVRFLCASAVVVFLVVLAALVAPEWAAQLGLQPERLTAAADDLIDPPPPDTPPPETAVLAARGEAKERVTHDLLAGRLTLLEAAALFRSVNERLPLPPATPGESDAESLCRQVINWATSVGVRQALGLDGDPRVEPPETCRKRLETELRCVQALRGAVALPDVADCDRYLRPRTRRRGRCTCTRATGFRRSWRSCWPRPPRKSAASWPSCWTAS
jgi:hypothetical protein